MWRPAPLQDRNWPFLVLMACCSISPGPELRGLARTSSRSFDGLLSTYYKPRWEKFFADVIAAVENGEPFDHDAFLSWCYSFEYAWWQVE